jgi:hypothetical protein
VHSVDSADSCHAVVIGDDSTLFGRRFVNNAGNMPI